MNLIPVICIKTFMPIDMVMLAMIHYEKLVTLNTMMEKDVALFLQRADGWCKSVAGNGS